MLKVLGVIPARFASTRFPAKLLEKVLDKSILEMVYLRALSCDLLTDLVVATDNELIYDHVKSFGGNVLMTSDKHISGTDRVAEALALLGGSKNFDYVVNIQGDEPVFSILTLEALIRNLEPNTQILSICKRIVDPDDVFDPNCVKLVMDNSSQALYFSRSPIPFLRDVKADDWLKHGVFYKHIGIYAYRADILLQLVKLPAAVLENSEKLEQLRWISNRFIIKLIETNEESIGVDTPEDLQKLRQFLLSKSRK